MTKHFIYNSIIDKSEEVKVYTLVFIPSIKIIIEEIQSELRTFFQENLLPHNLILLTGEYNEGEIIDLVENKREIIEDAIPTHYLKENLLEFISIQLFDKVGGLKRILNSWLIEPDDLKIILNQGMVQIFNFRSGLITSETSHHFVFPSGKHCNSFLRTGNILIRSEEIFFIAYNLLSFFNFPYEIIYCDTSSINSLAFALIELKRRLNKDFQVPHVESFGSYKKFEEGEFTDRHKALFLISSSTSANIIERLLDKLIQINQIALVYCLGKNKYPEAIACDLTLSPNNPNGIELFESYLSSQVCNFCILGSTPVVVQGDVFLLDKPKINTVALTVKDAPENISYFLQKYQSKNRTESNFIKCNFFENVNKSTSLDLAYEVFLDIAAIFKDLEVEGVSKFPSFREKLEKFIYQYMPSNTKFIIHLPDEGSRLFAEYIYKKIKLIVKDDYLPTIVSQNDINKKIEIKDEGAAFIVSSSMVEGGNLIYISKQMRKYEKLSLVYLVGFARPSNDDYLQFVKKNLGQGQYGIATNTFIAVETIFFNNSHKNTSWVIEKDFLKNICYFLEEQDENKFSDAINYFSTREKILIESQGFSKRGIANNIFYDNIFTNKPIEIDKNFAFLKYKGYHTNASQADIYFVISTIINKLRYSKDLNHCLIQTEYVRNLLDPGNFARFNDGIIQASILRASNKKELAYDLDNDLSRKMFSILIPIIIHHKSQYGEALLEFLYAICIRKLRLKVDILQELISIITTKTNSNLIVESFCFYIQKLIIENNKSLNDKYMVRYEA